MQQALIVFVRKPEAGKVKTRLAATIGDEAALTVYLKLVQHTHSTVQQSSADKFIFYAGEMVPNDTWNGEGFFKRLQPETGLGERMSYAFESVFAQGYKKVLIIGSDCPQLGSSHLAEAFEALNTNDVVIGPATDGGYYLLGTNTYLPELFENMAWSTETVYADTLKKIESLNLTVHSLEMLTDVDEEKDLPEGWR